MRDVRSAKSMSNDSALVRLRKKVEQRKALVLEILIRKEDLAKWMTGMMNEQELEQQLWKRRIGELQVDLEEKKNSFFTHRMPIHEVM